MLFNSFRREQCLVWVGIMIAWQVYMNIVKSPIECYTAAFHNKSIDPYLETIGFTRGMIAFSVPDFGVLFRCRAEGRLIDLEFGALFSLLKFIKVRLTDAGIESIKILSSNPEFFFSFTINPHHLDPGSERAKLLGGYSKQFKILVGLVESTKNKALISAADYPSLPSSAVLNLKPGNDDFKKIGFKPLQKGIKL